MIIHTVPVRTAMSLYRTYRPARFADVVGQEHVVTTLEHAAKTERLSHAYLFAGSRGTGKTSVARILAKTLMTRGIDDATLRSQIEKGVQDGSIVDLLEIDAASNRGIDDIRDLIEKIQFSPVVASAKVYIIDEVHMLTKEAFNALLKTLEEPPSYAHFILATTELHKIPSTIQSRCQVFAFRPVREEEIVRRLQYVADQEHITVEREALRIMARHVNGGMRDALSLLDQLRSLPSITVAAVQERTGTTGDEHVHGIVDALERRDAPAIIERIRQLEEAGGALDMLMRQLLTAVRNALHESVDAHQPLGAHLHKLDVLLRALRDMRNAPVPALAAEAALLELCNENENDTHAPTPARGSSTSHAAPSVAAPKPRTVPAAKPTPEDAPATETSDNAVPASALTEAPDITMETVAASWNDVLNEVTPPSVKMSLKDGRLREVRDTHVTICFSSRFHRDRVRETQASRTIETILSRIFKKPMRIECIVEELPVHPDDAHVNLAEAAAEIF